MLRPWVFGFVGTVGIPDELRVRTRGVLHLVSAGREPRRGLRVRYFSWGEFFGRLDGEGLLTTFLNELKGHYDHILVDCPQLSHASRFPVLNADILVACCTLDRESIEAGAAIARWATERLTARRLLVYPLSLRVSPAELRLLDQAREAKQRAFRGLEEVADIPTSSEYWSMEVPEIPFYAYQRVLPHLLGFGDGLGSMEATYLRLARMLTGQTDIEWKAAPEQLSAKYQSAYESATDRFTTHQMHLFASPYPGNEPYTFVSYAREDQDEVIPILQELVDLDWRLWWDEEIPGGADWLSYLKARIEKAHHMLVFVSERSSRSNWVAEEIRLAHDFGKACLTIRLDWSEFPEEIQGILSRYQMLDREAVDFREQLGRGMRFLQAFSDAI